MEPNKKSLYFFTGQPGQGKTTCSTALGKTLNCTVIHTDEVYKAWLKVNIPSAYRFGRILIKRQYPNLWHEEKRKWQEHLTTLILDEIEKANPDIIVEGWLLSDLHDDLRKDLEEVAYLLEVKMHRFTANTSGRQIAAYRGKYDVVNSHLRQIMNELHEASRCDYVI